MNVAAVPARYAIRGGQAGLQRLRMLSRVMAPTTSDLLGAVGVRRGSVWLDVGCGGGDVCYDLAERVGPQGQVIGIDIDPLKLEMAREEAHRRGLGQLEFSEGDVYRGLPDRVFDGVYARFLLSHLASPAMALEAFRERIVPGGWLVVEDIDASGHLAWPPVAAFQNYLDWYGRAVRRGGGDPDIGKRLPALIARSGLRDVQVRIVQPIALQGEAKHLAAATTEAIADTLYADGLASPDEVRETVAALRRFAEDPLTLIGTPRVFQVWARR